jgi:hypothetical protein
MDNAQFASALADALEAAAASLRTAVRTHESGLGSTAELREPGPTTAVERARRAHPQLGERQAEIIQLLEAAEPDGTDTGSISRTLAYDQPNVYLTLAALMRQQLAEKDPSTHPHRYRLGARIR